MTTSSEYGLCGGVSYWMGKMIGCELDKHLNIKDGGAIDEFPAGDYAIAINKVDVLKNDEFCSESGERILKKDIYANHLIKLVMIF
jgi:hypothetical protein